MNTLSIARTPAHPPRAVRAALAALAGLKAQLATWSARQRQRAAALALSDAELKDLGRAALRRLSITTSPSGAASPPARASRRVGTRQGRLA